MWPILVVILVALVFCLDYYINRTESGKLFNKIPGPRGIPVFGNIFSFLLDPVVLFAYSRTLANRYKRSYGIKLCGRRILNIFDPREIEIILSSHKHITKSILYDFLDPWLKEGLLTSKGSKWQKRRKILTPAFHFNILRQFCNIFSEQSGKIVQELRKEIYQPDTDIISYVTQFTINSICETAMGIQLDSSDGNTSKYFSKYKEAIRDMGKFLVYRLVRLWMHVTPFYNMSAVGKKQAEVLPDLHKFTLDVIRRRREATSVKGTSAIVGEIEDEDYMRSSKRRLAMLDLLLAAEADGKIDEPGIREEVDTFMFEGHDTTTMGITFCLMLLANHQFAQERIVEEMNEIFKDRNQIATMEDLNNMRYLELCLKESLRIYPSVPFISRALLEDVHMPNYTIPANTTCHIHIIDLHRDARIYPDPDKFIPERFLPENCAKRHPFAYIPFSAGPRNCIGQRFAMYELKSVVSTVLRNFILEPVTTPDDIIFSSDLVLRARDPIKIKFLPRYS